MTGLEVEHWASLMGRDLPRSEAQPRQAVRIGRNGFVRIGTPALRALGFSAGERLGLQIREGRCLLVRSAVGEGSVETGKPARLPVSQTIAGIISPPGATGAALIHEHGEGTILPVFVQEHEADLLGPRLIDELRENSLIRHFIPGPPSNGWTAAPLRELEDVLCASPLRVDPLPIIAEGNDWVGWMVRNRILGEPERRDEELRAEVVGEAARGQQEDGSWGSIPETAYAVLNLLTLGEDPSGDSVQRAAAWLLALPEPPPRPGMWMLNEDYLAQWLSRRQPTATRAFEACEFQWTPPDDEINFFSWHFAEPEQDQFRGQEMQRVIPTCARHHPPACEPRITHVSALVAEALIRCGYSDHPRLRRYLNTVSHLGGEWGYWCGCGALGLHDADIPPSEDEPDLDVRRRAEDGRLDLSRWRWVAHPDECALLANRSAVPDDGRRGTHLEPFFWHEIPGRGNSFALLGSAWQNGDCWAKTNRALAHHPSCPGSLTEGHAIYQASRYQTSLGEWDQGFPAGMLAFLSQYGAGAAKSLVIKTVPWLREHQCDDGLWHHERLARDRHGELAEPPEPRLATYHAIAAMHKFGLLDRLRPGRRQQM